MLNVDIEFVKMLFISALAGGLLGVEREYKVKVVAGTRTFMLFSMLGSFAVYISEKTQFEFLITVTVGAILLVLLLGVIKNFLTVDIGITTVSAFFLSFLLGVLVGLGFYLEAISASVIITAILISKKYSQMFSTALDLEEMRSAIEFGLVAFVLYPVLPENMNFFGIIYPKALLKAIIVITTLGFVGFLAVRLIPEIKPHPKSMLSAVVHYQQTLEQISKITDSASLCIASISAMLLRNLLLAGFISLPLFIELVPGVALFLIFGFFVALLLRGDIKEISVGLRIPFALFPALIFSAHYLVYSLIAFYTQNSPAFYFISFLAGIPYSAAYISALATLVAMGNLSMPIALSGSLISLLGSVFKAVIISRKNRQALKALAVYFILLCIATAVILLP